MNYKQPIILSLIPLSLILPSQLNSISIVLVSIYFFYLGYKEKSIDYTNLRSVDFTYFLIIIYAFFVDVIRGNELDTQRIVMTLSFLIFPLYSIFNISNKQKKQVLQIYAYSISILNFGLIIYTQIRHYFKISWIDESFRWQLDHYVGVHPTYYSIFALFSIVIIIDNIKSLNKVLLILAISINTLVIFLSGAKAIIIALVLIVIYIFITKLKGRGVSKRYILFFSIILAFVIIGVFLTNDRIVTLLEHLFNNTYNRATGQRVTIYKSIIGSFNSDFTFWGNGISGGYSYIKEVTNLDLNSHNQILQVYMNSGIIGITAFIYYIYNIALRVKKQRSFIFLTFSFIVIFSSLFENIFDRQWGIVFISFFIFILSDDIKTTETQ